MRAPYGIIECTCGTIIGQCPCLGPHERRVVEHGCDLCRVAVAASTEVPARSVVELHRLTRYLQSVFPGAMAQEPCYPVDVAIGLLAQLARGEGPKPHPQY